MTQTFNKHMSCSFDQPDTKGFLVKKINRKDIVLKKAFDHDILLSKM